MLGGRPTSGDSSFAGRQRFYTLGAYGPMTVQEARRVVVTIGELCDQYLAGCAEGRVRYGRKVKSPESLQNDRSLVERHIKALLAHKPIADLKRVDVEQFRGVIDVLSDLFILRSVPGHIRSDNGPEFVAKSVRAWISAVGARTAYIAPGSPWENDYIESFNARRRDELLGGEFFYWLKEAQIIIESWRQHYNRVRPHASLGYRAPAPEAFVPSLVAWPLELLRVAQAATLALARRPPIN